MKIFWEHFVEYFGSWTKEIFEIPDHSAIVDLRDFLRNNGVCVLKAAGVSIPGELAKTASEEKQHRWTVEEIATLLDKEEPFNSRYHPDHQSSRASLRNSHKNSPKSSPAAQLHQDSLRHSRDQTHPLQSAKSEVKCKMPDMSQIDRSLGPTGSGMFGGLGADQNLTIPQETVIAVESEEDGLRFNDHIHKRLELSSKTTDRATCPILQSPLALHPKSTLYLRPHCGGTEDYYQKNEHDDQKYRYYSSTIKYPDLTKKSQQTILQDQPSTDPYNARKNQAGVSNQINYSKNNPQDHCNCCKLVGLCTCKHKSS